MLPLQQAFEVKQSILEYIKATFSFKERETSDSFYGFIQDEEHGMFKGPYVSLKLPFKTNDESESIPLDIKPPWITVVKSSNWPRLPCGIKKN